ncbi:hypothetical protein VTI28DRAFT_3143 [Corynascus sepedonium]
MGVKMSEIQAKTGIKPSTFYALLRKAKERGYVPGGPVKEEYVADAPKSGRPTVITEPVAQAMDQVTIDDSTTRKGPSRVTLWRWSKRAGSKNVTLANKPGLKKVEMTQLESAMQVQD